MAVSSLPRNSVLVLLLLALATPLAASCGGGGNPIKDIQATATAVAQRTPSPTVDPVQQYIQTVRPLADDLSQLISTLDADLLAAQQSQSDPKWPGVLNSDIDLMIAKANQILAVTPPAGVDQTLTDQLNSSAEALISGGQLLKQAIQAADPNVAAQAVDLIDTAENNLNAVRQRLAA